MLRCVPKVNMTSPVQCSSANDNVVTSKNGTVFTVVVLICGEVVFTSHDLSHMTYHEYNYIFNWCGIQMAIT